MDSITVTKKRYRTVIRGWRGSPTNVVEIAGKVLSCSNWRTVEEDGEGEVPVCDVHVGDPDGGGKEFERVHIHASLSKRVDYAGCRVAGIGHDDT